MNRLAELTVYNFFGNMELYKYEDVANLMGLSTHPNALQHRIDRYPNEVLTINAQTYFTKRYVEYLILTQATKSFLEDEKKKLTQPKGGI